MPVAWVAASFEPCARLLCAMQVAKAVQPHAAVVMYDWSSASLWDLIDCINKIVSGSRKVLSIGVLAPGDQAGSVGKLVVLPSEP